MLGAEHLLQARLDMAQLEVTETIVSVFLGPQLDIQKKAEGLTTMYIISLSNHSMTQKKADC